MKKVPFYLLLCLLWACNSPEQAGPKGGDTQPVDTSTGQVLILNEGNFGWGEASLTQYNPATGVVRSRVSVSGMSVPLGNVLQSATQVGDDLYLVVNNSDRILRVQARTLAFREMLTGLGSPRYFIDAGNALYVTDLYAKNIHVLGKNPLVKIRSIRVGGWTETMAQRNNRLYVAGLQPLGTNTPIGEVVYVIDTDTGQLIDSLSCGGRGGEQVLATATGAVLTNYRQVNGSPGIAVFRAGAAPEVISTPQWARNIMLNKSEDTLYATWGVGLYRRPLAAGTWQQVFAIPAVEIYHAGIDTDRNELYLTDALDYTQPGVVYRISANGQQLQRFRAGIIPRFGLVVR